MNDPKALATTWPPRIIIAAPQGHSGKTVISIGLCASLKQRGLVVQPFKKGPDYIDPSWLAAAGGRDCHNLDPLLMPEQSLLASFERACQGADLALIEGSMGLYDSLDTTGQGSTARVARLLQSPVILIVNSARMTNSIAAMVLGYQHFDTETNIAAVILNNVSGSRHEQKLTAAVKQHCGIPVVGSVPRDATLNIAERHLGLIPYREAGDWSAIERIGNCLKNNLNLEAILAVARNAGGGSPVNVSFPKRKKTVVRIGVMLDHIFTFYYPENLGALIQAGAELVFINSVHDSRLPDIDGLYIGGGFPELYLSELEANTSLRQHIARAINNGLPVYAECAGLMYLCRGIRWHSRWHEMVGVIPANVEIGQKPKGHGYVSAEVTQENPWLPVGLKFWGHEFHYSKMAISGELNFAYQIRRGYGIDGRKDGVIYKNMLGAYTHLHSLGVPQWADALVSLALQERKGHRSLSVLTH